MEAEASTLVVPESSQIITPSEITPPEQHIEYGDLIVEYLAHLGVEYVFGVPGGGIEPLYNALARSARKGGPRPVVSRHETGAAFMANGYARESGRLGVCCGTTGPGATNLITGVSCAYTDGIPILVLTAQTALPTFSRGAAQESSCTGLNTVAMFEACTRFNSLVSHPEQLENKLLMAISHACSNTPGPVHLSVPLDILRQQVASPSAAYRLQPFTDHEVWPNSNVLGVLKKTLDSVSNAVVLVGQDSEPAINEILAFVEQKNWPIVTTPMGKGLVSSYHPLYRGVFGLAGHMSAYEALKPESAELVIAVGTALDECASGGWDELVMSSRLIHVDSNPNHLSRSTMACLCVLGSPQRVFQQLIDPNRPRRAVDTRSIPGRFPDYVDQSMRRQCLSQQEPIKPQALFWQLSQMCPINTRVAMDIGNSFLWGIHYWHTKNSTTEMKNLFHISIGFGSMGWALGAAVGIAIAAPEKPVVCFTGDGSLLMNGQEITTALEEDLKILFVVLNDGAMGTVKHGQRLAKAEPIAYDLPAVNFADIAKAMGIRAKRIQSAAELKNLNYDELMSGYGPCLLDVVIDGEEVPPLGVRMQTLGTVNPNAELTDVSTLAQPSESLNQDTITSTIWEEESQTDNPFVAEACYCHGYDVYGDLLGKVGFIDYLFLLFKGELPDDLDSKVLETLAVALANVGPREPSILAAMNAGVGGSTWSAALTSAVSVGSGQLGGAKELSLAYKLWQKADESIESWESAVVDFKEAVSDDIWPNIEHTPGFEPNGIECAKPVKQLLEKLSSLHQQGGLHWLQNHRQALEKRAELPLGLVGVAAMALHELGFNENQAELLYMILKLPGAAAHAEEQSHQGFEQFPFYVSGLKLENDPKQGEDNNGGEA